MANLRSASLTVDADAADGDLLAFRNRYHRRNPHAERIDIERILKVQRIHDLRDLKHESQTLARVFSVGLAGLADTKERNGASKTIGRTRSPGTCRQANIDLQHRRVIEPSDVLKIQEDSVRIG